MIINYKRIILIVLINIVCIGFAFEKLNISTDIIQLLPTSSRVFSDAQTIFITLPQKDKIALNISVREDNYELLFKAAAFYQQQLLKSDLFSAVGMQNVIEDYPDLISYIVSNLPYLLTEDELKTKLDSLLSAEKLYLSVSDNLNSLQTLTGTGQTNVMIADPLNFRSLIFKKIMMQLPTDIAHYSNGFLVSNDKKNILIVLEPVGNTTESETAQALVSCFSSLYQQFETEFASNSQLISINYAGAFQSAYENERVIRADVARSLTIATIVIIILVFLAFSRPLWGVVALVPALLGTISGFCLFALFFDSISLLTIGFGSAIISITVDHGIAYSIFLDQKGKTCGKAASRKIWYSSLSGTVTTMAGFLLLYFTGFTLLSQIGIFTASGLLCSFIYIHFVFPDVFHSIPGTLKRTPLLHHLIVPVFFSKTGAKCIIGIILLFLSLFYIQTKFDVSLESMNYSSSRTLESESKIQSVWGNLLDSSLFLLQAETLPELLEQSDSLTRLLSLKVEQNELSSFVSPSTMYPGNDIRLQNYTSWKNYWTDAKLDSLNINLKQICTETGMPFQFYATFLKKITSEDHFVSSQKEALLNQFNIYHEKGLYSGLIIYKKGDHYSPAAISDLIQQKAVSAAWYDPHYYVNSLTDFLSESFIRLLLIILLSVLVLLTFLLADIRLVMIVLVPLFFSFCATLSTLRLLNRPLDIPVLMLSVVVLGIGVDYALYMIKASQRIALKGYDDSTIRIGLIIFMAAFSTMAGFGALMFSYHPLLRSVGIVSFLGVFYSLLANILISPFLLQSYTASVLKRSGSLVVANSRDHIRNVVARYSLISPFSKYFAHYKMKLDPLFDSLLQYAGSPHSIIDIGAGFAVPAVWMLEIMPSVTYTGLEPDVARVEVANAALGSKGTVLLGNACDDLDKLPDGSDLALMLDMGHYLTDKEFTSITARIREKLEYKGRLLIRITIPGDRNYAWERILEKVRFFNKGKSVYFRSSSRITELLNMAGYTSVIMEQTDEKREETWFIVQNDHLSAHGNF
ncbi:MAG: hypothetical protein PF637_03660 [Spirochaetes bacterium]|nr:hypothetical protein [Spirochaetota bacterium]